jgi:hypothetical protein
MYHIKSKIKIPLPSSSVTALCNAILYVSFATDMDVHYQQEKLPFTCRPTSRVLSGTITDITLWKKSTSGWKEIVKIWLKIENGHRIYIFIFNIFSYCVPLLACI